MKGLMKDPPSPTIPLQLSYVGGLEDVLSIRFECSTFTCAQRRCLSWYVYLYPWQTHGRQHTQSQSLTTFYFPSPGTGAFHHRHREFGVCTVVRTRSSSAAAANAIVLDSKVQQGSAPRRMCIVPEFRVHRQLICHCLIAKVSMWYVRSYQSSTRWMLDTNLLKAGNRTIFKSYVSRCEVEIRGVDLARTKRRRIRIGLSGQRRR